MRTQIHHPAATVIKKVMTSVIFEISLLVFSLAFSSSLSLDCSRMTPCDNVRVDNTEIGTYQVDDDELFW